MTETVNYSLEHLQAEFARIDALIRREVRRWQLAGQDPSDAFRGLKVSDAEANALLSRPAGTSWGQTVKLPAKEAQAFESAYAGAVHRAESLAEAARLAGPPVRLEHLAATFDLDRFDLDALLICLAPALDLRYQRLYGYLQDDITRKQASASLALDLLCEAGAGRLVKLARFNDDAPLFRHRLLERIVEPGPIQPPLIGQSLVADDTIVSWLLGEYRPRAEISSATALHWPQANETDALFAAQAWPVLEGVQADAPPILVFDGPDHARQQAAARMIAAHLQRPLLRLDLAIAAEGDRSPLTAIALALRDARLTGAILLLDAWDVCLAAGNGAPPHSVLAELFAHPDLAIVAGRAPWQPAGVERDRHLLRVEFPIPEYAQRHALWSHFLAAGQAAILPYDIDALAGQFLLTTGQIRDAVALAKDVAAQRGEALADEHLSLAARMHSNPNLAGLARKITPRYQWADIVLPDDQRAILRELVSTIRGRPLVLEEWGLGKKLTASAGVTVLFAGPPGTGKTMAAEVIAAELGLDLFKIDLSTIVSKYIGETEKNLERIFTEAQSSNAILFFDEADAIFGKRSEVKDAHDRYANIEVSYLLQRMEAYDGVTILATNLRANLDEAFTRRLQFAVDFPFPDETYRRRIWETLFPATVPREPGLDIALLAKRFKLAGGSIRNILVGAAYLAASDGGRVTMQHLLHATRRELQKMGRLVNEKDMIDISPEEALTKIEG